MADRPILVVDFDGTVYRSDAPVRYYAERIAEALDARDARAYLDAFERYLVRGVAAAGEYAGGVGAVLASAEDAWSAVQGLAWNVYGVDTATTQAAFLDTRLAMLRDDFEVAPVPALVDALAELGGRIRIVLATNSPEAGLAPLLDRLGVAGLFAEVVPGARKPEGLREWMTAALAGRPAAGLFSLGDHYRNEIEPAMAIGAAAGYIDRFGRADGPATASAPRVEDLLPAIRAWAESSL